MLQLTGFRAPWGATARFPRIAASQHAAARQYAAVCQHAADEGDTVVKTRPADPQVQKPPLYKVILLNDDYTPMEFVVVVLMKFFRMDQERATQFMLAVHTTGSAVVGIFPRDVAETKSEQVNAFAQEHDHPLRSTVEMTD